MTARLPVVGNPCFSHACTACCMDTQMPLADADVARLVSAGRRRNDFAEVRDGELRLKNVDGHCVFLAGGRCTVHELRPEGCRLYPLVWVEGKGPGLDRLCPWRTEFTFGKPDEERLQKLVEGLGPR